MRKSRYATNPLWLLAADLHRSFAQAQKACTHESVLHNAPSLEAICEEEMWSSCRVESR